MTAAYTLSPPAPRSAALLSLSVSLLVASAGCGVRQSEANGGAPAVEPILSVASAAVVERRIPRTLTLTGTLAANRRSDVAADAMGKVAATYVERGTIVAAGAPLARLDRRTAALQQQEAAAQAAAASTQSALAERECRRAELLFSEGAINRAEYDRSRAGCEGSQHTASAISARARLAQKSVGDAVIRAPFGGVVAERFANTGEYVRPDSRVATVMEVDPLRLELTVAETDVAAVSPGQEVVFQVVAYPGELFRGRVKYVGPAIRRASRDLVAEAVIPNKGGKLRPGMFATVRVAAGQQAVPMVPASAVRPGDTGNGDRLFVIAGERIEERVVQVGDRHDAEVTILSGVRPGERVVARVSGEVRDGARVRAGN